MLSVFQNRNMIRIGVMLFFAVWQLFCLCHQPCPGQTPETVTPAGYAEQAATHQLNHTHGVHSRNCRLRHSPLRQISDNIREQIPTPANVPAWLPPVRPVAVIADDRHAGKPEPMPGPPRKHYLWSCSFRC